MGGSVVGTTQRKHGISFEDAMHIFDDPYALFERNLIDETGGTAVAGNRCGRRSDCATRNRWGRNSPLHLGAPSHPEGAKTL